MCRVLAVPTARVLLALGLVAPVALAGGCGGGNKEEGRTLANTSIVSDAKPLPKVLISRSEELRYPSGSVQRAFLEYWSALQFQSWPAAVSFFDPEIRNDLGVARVAEALRSQAPYFRSTKPAIVAVTKSRDGETVVRYLANDRSGNAVTRAVAWHRLRGEWAILFDSFLPEALQSGALAKEQARIDPTARTPSANAIAAGRRAAELPSKAWARRRSAEP